MKVRAVLLFFSCAPGVAARVFLLMFRKEIRQIMVTYNFRESLEMCQIQIILGKREELDAVVVEMKG